MENWFKVVERGKPEVSPEIVNLVAEFLGVCCEADCPDAGRGMPADLMRWAFLEWAKTEGNVLGCPMNSRILVACLEDLGYRRETDQYRGVCFYGVRLLQPAAWGRKKCQAA